MPRTLVATQTFRPPNLMINGAFDFWQRSTSATANTGEAYITADRFMFRASGSGATYTSSRSTDVPSSIFKYSVSMVDSDAISDAICITQKIEAANIRPYIGKTITFSCWVKNESTALTSQIRALVPVSGVEDSWSIDSLNVDTVVSQSSVIALTSGVWTKISHTFVVPASATSGMSIYVFTNAVTGTPSLKTTGWMLTEGPTPPADFYRAGANLQDEFAMCERYFVKITNINPASFGDRFADGVCQSAASTNHTFYYTMRPVAIITDFANVEIREAGNTVRAFAVDFANNLGSIVRLQTTSAGLTIGNAANLRFTAAGGYLSFSTEL